MRSGTTRRIPVRFELAAGPRPAAVVVHYTLEPITIDGEPITIDGEPLTVRVRHA